MSTASFNGLLIISVIAVMAPVLAASALRRAQRWLRDTSNEELLEAGYASAPQSGDRAPQVQAFWRKARPYYHPYYWAAFTFYGA